MCRRDTIAAAAAAAASGGAYDAGKPDAETCAPFLDTEAKVGRSHTAYTWLSHSLGSAANTAVDGSTPVFHQALLHVS